MHVHIYNSAAKGLKLYGKLLTYDCSIRIFKTGATIIPKMKSLNYKINHQKEDLEVIVTFKLQRDLKKCYLKKGTHRHKVAYFSHCRRAEMLLMLL
jgi:CTP-dependent riboflavin kinase